MFILIFILIDIIVNLFLLFLNEKKAKDCNYECSNCKAWDCRHRYCVMKRGN